jgi:hypothetical protein
VVPFTVADADTPLASLVVTAASDNQTLVPDANLVPGGANGARTLTITPALNQHGTATITVTVIDPGGLFATDAFLLTVTAVNDPPSFVLAAGHTSLEDAGGQVVPGFASAISVGPPDEGAGGQTPAGFTLTQTGTTGGLTFAAAPALDAAGTLTYTAAPHANGTATYSVVLADSAGATSAPPPPTFTITVTPVNDAPSFTLPTPSHTSAEDAGAQSVTGFATAISAGPPNESPPVQTLTLAVTGNTNPALFVGGAAPAISPKGTLTYTAAPDLHGSATVTVVLRDDGGTADGGANESAPQTVTVTVTAVNDAPTAVAQSYTAQTNMRRTIAAPGLLEGAADDPDESGSPGYTPTLSVGTVGATTPAGGTITNLNPATGAFDFDPPPGVTGNVTFTYTVCDTGDPAPGLCSAPATVAVAVSGPVIWFVDDSAAAGGTGRLSAPFQTVAAAGTAIGATTGHRIFLYAGTYATGRTLNTGEWLVGQGVTNAPTNTFDALMGISPPDGTLARPDIATGTVTVQGTVTLNTDGAVRGLALSTGTATGMNDPAGAITGVTVDQVAVTTTTGTAVTLSSAQGGFAFTSISTSGAANGILLDALGASNFTAAGGAIAGATTRGVDVNGGSGAFTYAGTISTGGGTARSVEVTNRTGGAALFSGAVTEGSLGINLDNNDNSTVTFSGGLAASTGANPAFTAVNGGTVTVCAANPCGGATAVVNTLATTTGTALNVANTTIGASGLTFRSIFAGTAASGPTNGIVLNSTGSSGGLTVTGTGAGGSGGIIQRATGDGILLTTTERVSLSYMNITNNLGGGIGGSGINGFQLANCSITGNGNDAATDESGINVTQLTGTASGGARPTSITNSTISNNNEFEIQITNTSGTLTDLVLSGNTISSNGLPINGNVSSPHGNLVNFLALGTASMTLNVTNVSGPSTFTGNTDTSGGRTITATDVQCDHSGTGGTMTCNIADATFTNNNVGPQASVAGNGTVVFDFNGNNIQGSRAIGINFFADADPPFPKSLQGRVRNNIIGTPGTTGSASSIGFPIRAQNEGRVPVTIAITGDTISESENFTGINVNHGITLQAGTAATNVTITGNTIREIDSGRAIVVQQLDHLPAGGNAGTVCADISGNVISNVAGQAGDGTYIRLRRSESSATKVFNVRQAAPTTAATATELDDANGFNDPARVSIGGSPTFNGGACAQPSN